MQAIAKALNETPTNAAKPLLFHGPSHSGKKTLLRQALVSRGYHVVVLEAPPDTLRSRSIFGKVAYIIDCTNSLKRAATPDGRTLVVYVQANPYERYTAAQLNASFKLVDLSRTLDKRHYRLEVDAKDNNLREAPWVAVQRLTSAHPPKSFEDKLRIVQANPNLTYLLRDNAVAAPEFTDAIAEVLARYSELDTLAYSMNSDLKATLEVLYAARGMRLTPSSTLQYRLSKPPPLTKPNPNALYEFKALSKPEASVKRKKKAAPSTTENPPKKRKPPTCRKCGRPRKGHGAAC